MTPFSLLLRTIRWRVLTGFAALILLQAAVAIAVWQAENQVETAMAADAEAEAATARAIAVRQDMHRLQVDLGAFVRTGGTTDREKLEGTLADLQEAAQQIGRPTDIPAAVDAVRAGLEGVIAASIARRDSAAALSQAAARPENSLSALAQAATRTPDRATVEAAAAAIAASIHPLTFAERYAFGGDPPDADIVGTAAAEVKQALADMLRETERVTPRIERLVGVIGDDLDGLEPAIKALGQAIRLRADRLAEVDADVIRLNDVIADLNHQIGSERLHRHAETVSARHRVRLTVGVAASIAVLIGLALAALVVTSIMRAGRRQQATQSFLDTVLENVPVPIFVKRVHDLSYVHVNRAAEAFHGAPKNTLLGRKAQDALPDPDAIVARDRAVLAAGGTAVDDDVVLATRHNGKRLATVTRCVIAGPDGQPEYLLNMIDDVTERRAAEQRIAHMAHYDALTDLPNRVLFAERLAEAVQDAARQGTRLAVFGLDLDHFKAVNDTLGHAAGDQLLRSVAQRMNVCLRTGDTLARIGGDEFAVIQCSIQSNRNAEALAARLIETIRKPFDISGQKVFVGISVGIAFSMPGTESAELVKRADMALYEAKECGRGCFRCFIPEMDVRLQERRSLEHDLRAAVGTEQFSLLFQPQVDLDSRRILGAEAQLCWHRPGHGDILPDSFIPFAEDAGLIGTLGGWVLTLACTEAAGWPAPLHVAVNVSPVQLRLPGFVESVSRALNSTGLEPARLELEITEGALVHDTEQTREIFDRLRAIGVRLVLDDFGVSYASLAYLQNFPFDKIKIDRSFIESMATTANAAAIVRAVIDLCHSLGMRSNAEGVETDQEIERLRAMGCREAQGDRLWGPMNGEAVRRVVSGQKPEVEASLRQVS